MIADTQQAKSTCLVILAAGLGKRFGDGDKLAQEIEGRPVAQHILESAAPFPWHQKRLICRGETSWSAAFRDAGFELIINPDPAKGLSSSLRLGAHDLGLATHLCVCLADMPRITQAHLARLLKAASDTPNEIIATCGDTYRGPPVLFPVSDLALLPEAGDQGARPLLKRARIISADPETLLDLDTPNDLARLRTHPPKPPK